MSARPSEDTRSWINRSTLGVSFASLFSDVSHELATAVLPAVLLSIGAGPASLGITEGIADGISSVAKLWGGVATDRVRRRKPLASIGYLITAVGIAAIGLTTRAWQVVLCRSAAWIGRGSRSAPRDFLMSEAAPPEHLGKAFGMERAGDALGAVLGPLLALSLIAAGLAPRQVMLWSLLPGLLAFLSMSVLVVERPEPPRPSSTKPTSLWRKWGDLGRPFRFYLVGILIFGSGDFSRTLLILYAIQHLEGTLFSWTGATLAIALYVLHNAVSALAAFPLGALTDRIGRRPVIVSGYLFAAATTVGFALLPPRPWVLAALFVASGLYIACEEVSEKAYAVELLPREVKGTGLGLLASVNGIGDMISSIAVGSIWAVFPNHPGYAFTFAAALQFAGALTIVGTGRVPVTQQTK